MRTAYLSLLLAATLLADPFTAAQKKHWAFQKVSRPPVPAVDTVNPIDAFVLVRLQSKHLSLSPPADKTTLLRRVTFDLVGLPPTPEETRAFLHDGSANAYEKVVDRLLASPHYGERWGRHWLDLARYAESEGFKSDETRPNAWRYRDYVIRAFNNNTPYDRFVQEQIAGDELWPSNPDARVATAFNRHYPDESNARNLMQRRQEILDDITDVTGSVFMGLTYGCARCHDHKYDPILQSDYYRLQAFYANTTADDQIPLYGKAELEKYKAWEEQTKAVREQIATLLEPAKKGILKEFVDKYPAEIQTAIAKPAAERTPYEWMMFYKAKPYLEIDDDAAGKSLKGADKARYKELKAELDKYPQPGELPTGIGMRDISATAPPTHILRSGVWDNPGNEVQPGFLTLLAPGNAAVTPGPNTTGRRTALAKWLTDPSNPLTARVMVNRLWHYHFGQGIAGSPSDFGIMGQRPTHPELLDYLADEFVKTGWDIKRMHKLIVTSETYRQSSAYNEAAAKADERNRLLWRYPRERLEGEVIRDAALAVSGLLNSNVGGPSVMPELPVGMLNPRGGWKVSKDEERNRRSVYIFVRRNTRYPMLEAFDMPDTHESCGRRNVTVTPTQALSMLNDRVVLEWAKAFAARLEREGGADTRREIELAYELAYSRQPDASEKDAAFTFLDKQRTMAGNESAALADFCHMLLSSNEFAYRN